MSSASTSTQAPATSSRSSPPSPRRCPRCCPQLPLKGRAADPTHAAQTKQKHRSIAAFHGLSPSREASRHKTFPGGCRSPFEVVPNNNTVPSTKPALLRRSERIFSRGATTGAGLPPQHMLSWPAVGWTFFFFHKRAINTEIPKS